MQRNWLKRGYNAECLLDSAECISQLTNEVHEHGCQARGLDRTISRVLLLQPCRSGAKIMGEGGAASAQR